MNGGQGAIAWTFRLLFAGGLTVAAVTVFGASLPPAVGIGVFLVGVVLGDVVWEVLEEVWRD